MEVFVLTLTEERDQPALDLPLRPCDGLGMFFQLSQY